MSTDSVIVRHYHAGPGGRDAVMAFTVQYREIPHYSSSVVHRSGRKLKQYEVLIDGEVVGRVHSYEGHSWTTYKGTRIRRDLGRPLEWAWDSAYGGKTRSGLENDRTRRGAVVSMLRALRWDLT